MAARGAPFGASRHRLCLTGVALEVRLGKIPTRCLPPPVHVWRGGWRVVVKVSQVLLIHVLVLTHCLEESGEIRTLPQLNPRRALILPARFRAAEPPMVLPPAKRIGDCKASARSRGRATLYQA